MALSLNLMREIAIKSVETCVSVVPGKFKIMYYANIFCFEYFQFCLAGALRYRNIATLYTLYFYNIHTYIFPMGLNILCYTGFCSETCKVLRNMYIHVQYIQPYIKLGLIWGGGVWLILEFEGGLLLRGHRCGFSCRCEQQLNRFLPS